MKGKKVLAQHKAPQVNTMCTAGISQSECLNLSLPNTSAKPLLETPSLSHGEPNQRAPFKLQHSTLNWPMMGYQFRRGSNRDPESSLSRNPSKSN